MAWGEWNKEQTPHVILTTPLLGRDHPHFTDEESEAPRRLNNLDRAHCFSRTHNSKFILILLYCSSEHLPSPPSHGGVDRGRPVCAFQNRRRHSFIKRKEIGGRQGHARERRICSLQGCGGMRLSWFAERDGTVPVVHRCGWWGVLPAHTRLSAPGRPRTPSCLRSGGNEDSIR